MIRFGKRRDAGVDAELHAYSGIGHWFANRDVVSATTSRWPSALSRTVEFLRYNLA